MAIIIPFLEFCMGIGIFISLAFANLYKQKIKIVISYVAIAIGYFAIAIYLPFAFDVKNLIILIPLPVGFLIAAAQES